MRTDLAGTACVLLVAPQGAKETVLQVPVDAGADTAARIAVSRVAEGLRRAAEALQEKEAAE